MDDVGRGTLQTDPGFRRLTNWMVSGNGYPHYLSTGTISLKCLRFKLACSSRADAAVSTTVKFAQLLVLNPHHASGMRFDILARSSLSKELPVDRLQPYSLSRWRRLGVRPQHGCPRRAGAALRRPRSGRGRGLPALRRAHHRSLWRADARALKSKSSARTRRAAALRSRGSEWLSLRLKTTSGRSHPP